MDIPIPESLAVATFDKLLVRGQVIHFRCTFKDTGEVKNKFAVVLNRTLPEHPILYALAHTAKTAHDSFHYSGVLIRIPAGTYSFFTKATVINLRNVHEEDLEAMRTQYARKELTVVGQLLKVHMDQANKMIDESLTIETWKVQRCRAA